MTTRTPPPGQYLTMRLNTPSQATDTSAPVRISGVANDSSVTDSFGTRIKVSQRALDTFMSNPVMLLNHDVHNPIGRFTSVRYNGDRLEVEGEIDPDARTNTGASVADLARKGILRALSVRFDEYKETRAKDYVQLDADMLDEISVVTLPSNRASLFGLRSKGVNLHGAPELLDQDEHTRAADLRTPGTERAAGPLNLDLLTRRLHRLVREECGDDDSWYNTAYLVTIHDDTFVWSTYDDARFYQRGYSVGADGNVTLTGEDTEVLPTWTAVGAPTPPPTNDPGERSAQSRLHPDDLAAITAQVTRALQPAGAPAAAAAAAPEPVTPPAPEDAEIPIDQGLAQLRSVINPAPTPTTRATEPLSMDDVRAAIRAAAT